MNLFTEHLEEQYDWLDKDIKNAHAAGLTKAWFATMRDCRSCIPCEEADAIFPQNDEEHEGGINNIDAG